MSDTGSALNLFLNGFKARDIADPLLSFDDSVSPDSIRAALKVHRVDEVGLRNSGRIAGWVTQDDLASAVGKLCPRKFDAEIVVSDSASLNDIAMRLGTAPCIFVEAFGEISGIIRVSSLQKPPMRMWLFGLVTITELRITRSIDESCPRESWRKYVSASRLQKAKVLQRERRHRGQDPSLLNCLQFADKGQIVARDEALRQRTQFESRRAVEVFVKDLQDLRNNLAHSQDLTGDWKIILELAANLHRIVLGPPDPDGNDTFADSLPL